MDEVGGGMGNLLCDGLEKTIRKGLSFVYAYKSTADYSIVHTLKKMIKV